ncbi:uncharacterized protein ACBT57_003098 isoform 2-T2 [Dama dama]
MEMWEVSPSLPDSSHPMLLQPQTEKKKGGPKLLFQKGIGGRIKFRSHRRLYMPKIKQKTNNPPPRPPAALHTSLFPCTEFQLRGPHQEFACRHHLPICPWDPWLPSWPVKHLQSRPVESANISMPACPGENAETDSELGLEANRLLPGPILQPA